MPVRFAPEVGMRWDHATSNFHALHMDGWMASLTCSPRRWIRLSCPSPFPRDSGSTGFLQCSFQQSIEALSTETDTKGYIGVMVKYSKILGYQLFITINSLFQSFFALYTSANHRNHFPCLNHCLFLIIYGSNSPL